jgi:hypothetical protein
LTDHDPASSNKTLSFRPTCLFVQRLPAFRPGIGLPPAGALALPLGRLGLLARLGIVIPSLAMVNCHWFTHSMPASSLPAGFGK